jgi:predicted translin family RNA/ssDNA-binding protein
MNTNSYSMPLSFEQILTVVRQLPEEEKLRLSHEMEKDARNVILSRLLKDFKTDEIDLESINEEVEAVRAKLYEQQKAN